MAILVANFVALQKVVASQNEKVLAAKGLQPEIVNLQARIKARESQLEEWATRNRKALGLVAEQKGDVKSLELRHGVIGFRWSNRAIKLLKDWTDEKVLEKLREFRARFLKLKGAGKISGKLEAEKERCFRFTQLIRVKEEVNRQQALALSKPEVDGRLTEADLAEVGLEADRTESFYVEPKVDHLAAGP